MVKQSVLLVAVSFMGLACYSEPAPPAYPVVEEPVYAEPYYPEQYYYYGGRYYYWHPHDNHYVVIRGHPREHVRVTHVDHLPPPPRGHVGPPGGHDGHPRP